MATSNPWTPAEDTILRALHESGRSLHSIAAEMKRGKASIHRHAERLGLTWDRAQTAKAAQAVAIDNRARRAIITSRVYDEAEDVLTTVETGRAGQGWRTILKGEHGVENEVTLTFVPSRDRREVSDTLSRLLTTAAKLEAVDKAADTGDGKSVLGDLMHGLRALHANDQVSPPTPVDLGDENAPPVR